ncbi:hypothetical protein SHJG_p251 (plasmid) [Streptomyces hygroscopicus subsp. jinggangensis 5008]|nr:hypothetical protein SHJG_p251 [Streptomyces hygroscopicus subsp. jinggangensis 5008]AGF68520.1 hypothetical protein SHJGH_p251 [Streptomyces hygroscopicus subsp. jinggangensis TL01]
MAELQMSPKVRALLGPEGLARAAEVSLAGGQCVTCRRPLDGTVNVVVRTNGSFTHVGYVHAGCGPSEVIEMGDDFAPAEPADGYAMTMTAAVLDHGGADLPILVAETVSKAYVINDGSGELTNVVASHLLGNGFHLVTRLRQAPPQAAEWIGVLLLGHGPAGEDGLLVLDPDGGQLYAGSVDLPDGWLTQAARYGWAVLYVGNVGGLDPRAHDAKATAKALRTAAQAGQLVGARIAVGTPEPART